MKITMFYSLVIEIQENPISYNIYKTNLSVMATLFWKPN